MRIYMAVTFWGEEYRRYFIDFCLASLLAAGNIPAITDKTSARLLIATNDDDWMALQTEPTFLAVKRLISIEHVPFAKKHYATAHEKMLVMSEAHRKLAGRMFEDRANGIFLYPDSIVAMGFVSKLEELRRNGSSVVMFMNVRFANEGLIGELERRQLIKSHEPIALSARELARLTIEHMHSELKRSGFDNSFNDHGCTSFFWIVAPEQDLLFHCGCWIPLLIDYGSINTHDDSTFEYSTLDGDYVARNLTDLNGVHFVRDTTELFMISFTREATVRYSLEPVFWYRIPLVRKALKVVNAHAFLYHQAPMDWMTKEQFRIAVKYRGGDSPEGNWRDVESRAAKIVQRIESGGNSADRLLFCLSSPSAAARRSHALWIYRLLWVVFMLWLYRAPVVRRIGQIILGDRLARKRATWRFRQYTYVVMGRQFSEPEPQT